MPIIHFDKPLAKRKLEAGAIFTGNHAEAISDAVHNAMTEGVATKGDIDGLRLDIALLETKMAELNRLTIIWISGLVIALGTALHFLK